MTRTPLFWLVLYVHTAFGVVAIVAPILALLRARGSEGHRAAGWWFVQAVAGVFATTAVLASIRYTLFLFVIGYVAWYAAHQGSLAAARPSDRRYLASPLARNVQHDLAMVLGVALALASVATAVHREWRITPWGLGLGVSFVYGAVLAMLGWAGRTQLLARLPAGKQHHLLMGLAVTATFSEFFADVTVHFMPATGVWLTSWIAPAVAAAWWVGRAVGATELWALVRLLPQQPAKRIASL